MQLKRIKVGGVLFAIHWFAGMIHAYKCYKDHV